MVDEITNPPDEALTLPFLKAANLSPWTVICCESGHPPTDIHNVPGNRDFDKVVRLSRRTYQHPHTTKAQQKEFRQRLMGRYNFGVWNDRTKSYGPYYAETAQLTKRFLQKKAFYILNKSYRPDPNVTELLYQAPNAIRQLFNGLPDPEYDDEVEVLVVVPPPGQAPAPLLPAPPALQAPPQLLAAVAPPAAAPPPAALPPPPPPPAPQAVLPPPPIASRSIVRGIKAFGTILAVLVAFFVFSSILGMGVLFGHEIAVSVGLTNFKSTAPTASTGSATTTGRFFPPRTLVRDASPVDVGPNLDGTMESSAIDFDLAPAVDPIDVRRVDGDLHADPSRNVTGRMRLADDSPGCVEEPPWSDIAVAPGTASDNRLADTPVAPSTVARVDDVIEDTTDCPPIHEHHIPDGGPILGGMDMSSTSGCIFVAPDTCVVDTVVCCECDDIAEMDIKTGVGTDSVSDEDTKDKAITGEANESNDHGSTSSFLFLYVGGVLAGIFVICIVLASDAFRDTSDRDPQCLVSEKSKQTPATGDPTKRVTDATKPSSGRLVLASSTPEPTTSEENNQPATGQSKSPVINDLTTRNAETRNFDLVLLRKEILRISRDSKDMSKEMTAWTGFIRCLDQKVELQGNKFLQAMARQTEVLMELFLANVNHTTQSLRAATTVPAIEEGVSVGATTASDTSAADGVRGNATATTPDTIEDRDDDRDDADGLRSDITVSTSTTIEDGDDIRDGNVEDRSGDSREQKRKRNAPFTNVSTNWNQFKNGTKKRAKNLGKKAKKPYKFVRNVFKNGKSEEESHLPVESPLL